MDSKSDILREFGEKIRGLRKARGISQEELAEMAGLHRTYIGMIERAEKNITLILIRMDFIPEIHFTRGLGWGSLRIITHGHGGMPCLWC